jgi:phospholipase C
MIRHTFSSILIAFLLLGVQFFPAYASSSTTGHQPTTPIQHLVILMQENHTFDNYFGTYPAADGLPAGTKMPIDPNNLAAGFVTPWHIGSTTITDINHSASTFQDQYNNGKMDGFVSALNARNQDGKLAMGYYDGTDIPYYWNLADNYVLFDQFFSSAQDGSFANHMFWVAAIPPVAPRGVQLSEALANVTTIFDELQAAGVSWKFYVQNYDPTITYRNVGTSGNRASQVIWIPLLYFDRFIEDPALSSHIVDLSQYYVDLQHGSLPAVSYIVPSGASEHPPSSLSSGQRFVKSIIQELMRSSAWDSSAFMLAYDDWGGWYDHVIPPQVDQYGYGPRVPVLLVSPYAKSGYIDNTMLDFTSMLKFIEQNWNIAPLSQRDALANNFLSAFDFSQPPRLPIYLPLTRITHPAEKNNPTDLIYLGYSAALSLSIATIGVATYRSRKQKTPKLPEKRGEND